MVTQSGNPSMREILFYSHDVIERPSVRTYARTYIRPYVRTYAHPSMYANVTSIMLVYSMHLNLILDIHVLIDWHL